jgi:hypothetical protein
MPKIESWRISQVGSSWHSFCTHRVYFRWRIRQYAGKVRGAPVFTYRFASQQIKLDQVLDNIEPDAFLSLNYSPSHGTSYPGASNLQCNNDFFISSYSASRAALISQSCF